MCRIQQYLLALHWFMEKEKIRRYPSYYILMIWLCGIFISLSKEEGVCFFSQNIDNQENIASRFLIPEGTGSGSNRAASQILFFSPIEILEDDDSETKHNQTITGVRNADIYLGFLLPCFFYFFHFQNPSKKTSRFSDVSLSILFRKIII